MKDTDRTIDGKRHVEWRERSSDIGGGEEIEQERGTEADRQAKGQTERDKERKTGGNKMEMVRERER